MYNLSLEPFFIHAGESTFAEQDTCSDSCDIETYSVDLSASQISKEGVNQLLNKNREQVMMNYYHAKEIRHRVDMEEIHQLIQALLDLKNSRQSFAQSIKSDLADSSTSIPVQIEESISNFDTYIVVMIEKLMDNVQTYQDEYYVKMKSFLSMCVKNIDTLSADLSTFQYGVNNLKIQNGTLDNLKWLEKIGHNTKTSIDNVINLLHLYDTVKTGVNSNQPVRLVSNPNITSLCKQITDSVIYDLETTIMTTVESVLALVTYIIETNIDANFQKQILDNLNFSFLAEILKSKCFALIQKLTILKKQHCFDEYEQFLNELIEWKSYLQSSKRSRYHDFSEILNNFYHDIETIDGLLQNYSLNTLTKESIASSGHFEASSDFIVHTTEAWNIFQSNVNGPLVNLLDDMEKVIKTKCLQALKYYQKLHKFFDKDDVNFKHRAQDMKIWLKPILNLDSPQVRCS